MLSAGASHPILGWLPGTIMIWWGQGLLCIKPQCVLGTTGNPLSTPFRAGVMAGTNYNKPGFTQGKVSGCPHPLPFLILFNFLVLSTDFKASQNLVKIGLRVYLFRQSRATKFIALSVSTQSHPLPPPGSGSRQTLFAG